MNEIERAIQEFEDNAYHTSMKPTISEASKAVALRILRAELSRQENAPLTWNERINQMTVEEKAKWLYDMDVCRVSSISIEECNSFRHCVECMKSMLASPYTEGEKK